MKVTILWTRADFDKTTRQVIAEVYADRDRRDSMPTHYRLYEIGFMGEGIEFEVTTLDRDALSFIHSVGIALGCNNIESHVHVETEPGKNVSILEFASFMCKKHWTLRESVEKAYRMFNASAKYIKHPQLKQIREYLGNVLGAN
jgi:hypothetical protein